MLHHKGYSVNALAELGLGDRRTLARRVRELEAVAHGPSGPLYALRDVLALLRQDDALGELWQPVDHALEALLEAATADLDALADRLARTRKPEVARRLVLELVADAAYRGYHAANPRAPEPPDWCDAPDADLERAFAALHDPNVPLDDVVEILEDGG